MMKTITVDGVNCYLISAGEGFLLIDTGYAKSRAALEKELEEAGCRPGNLKLILITHGDFDHTGNGAYLREKYGAKIAMHRDDACMAEQGDMLKGRKIGDQAVMRVIMKILLFFMGGGRFDCFSPDIFLGDGQDLCAYGFAARVLYIPGHSKGSIAFLTDDGNLFCGDLLENTRAPKRKPVLNSLIDDLAVARASVEKLSAYLIRTVYPGHGDPFPMELFMEEYRRRQL